MNGTGRGSPRTMPGRCGGCLPWCRCRDRSTMWCCPGCAATCCWKDRTCWPALRRIRRPGGAWPESREASGMHRMNESADILVAGAGPAGLTLALQAHDHGAIVRVIDRRPEAARPSRALILHSRTLEVLRPLGVTQALLARADIAPRADLRLGSRMVRVTLDGLALPDTAFPHLSLIRQMDVERVLAQALADRGVRVERGTELAGVCGGPEDVRATLRSPAGTEEILI